MLCGQKMPCISNAKTSVPLFSLLYLNSSHSKFSLEHVTLQTVFFTNINALSKNSMPFTLMGLEIDLSM